MKKNYFVFLCGILSAVSVKAADTTFVYYTSVSLPPHFFPEYLRVFDTKILAEDAAMLLQKATGKPFAAKKHTKQVTGGIFLLLDNALKLKKNESSILTCNGSNTLTIKAKYITGLSYGLYTYLDKLGFNFYLPGDNWSFIPTKAAIFTEKVRNKEVYPPFPVRWVSISGDMQILNNLDETRKNVFEWYKWFRRNRMGNEYLGFGGHMGDLFNVVNKELIDKDSLIVAPVNGKRAYNEVAKIDPTYKKGVDTFINFLINQYRVMNDPIPKFIQPYTFQSADMGDGLNYCHTPACETTFKSVSDQQYYIANLAAKKINKLYPGSGINVYAYTERADTPTIKIEPNVHVVIVSNAFQNVATPAGLIKRWADKKASISIYDYINIGVWNAEEPFFNLDTYFDYLNFIKKNKIEGIHFETGASMFSAAIPQYFILKFLNNPAFQLNSSFETFCKNQFGNAAPYISQLFREWYFSTTHLNTLYDRDTYSKDELARFAWLLHKAETTAGINSNTKACLEQLKYYLVFLNKAYNQYKNIRNTDLFIKYPDERDKKLEELIQFTWKKYPDLIFHNTQITLALKEAFLNPELKKKWYLYDGCKPCVEATKINQAETVRKEFNELLQEKNVVTSFPSADEAFFSKALHNTADSILVKMIHPEAYGQMRYPINIYASAPGTISIRYSAGKSLMENVKKTSVGFAAIQSSHYSYLPQQFITYHKREGVFTFQIPAKGFYTLFVAQQNQTPVSFIIKPGKTNLLYLNKKHLTNAGVSLHEEDKNSPYDNRFIAFYPPATDSLRFHMIAPGCINVTTLFNDKGEQLTVNNAQSPFYIAAGLNSVKSNSFIYYETQLAGWMPVFDNIPPYFFFLKRPPVK